MFSKILEESFPEPILKPQVLVDSLNFSIDITITTDVKEAREPNLQMDILGIIQGHHLQVDSGLDMTDLQSKMGKGRDQDLFLEEVISIAIQKVQDLRNIGNIQDQEVDLGQEKNRKESTHQDQEVDQEANPG